MGTNVNDVLIPEVLAEAIQGKLAGVIALYGTGAVAMDTNLRAEKANVGTDIKVPYFNTLGEAEEVPVGGALTPRKLTEEYETSTIKHAGIAFSSSDLVRIAAADDPHAEAARQAVVSIQRKFDSDLITTALSETIPATNATSGGAWPFIVDAYAAGRNLDLDTGIDARMAFGDEQRDEDFALWAIHSKQLGDLYRLRDATGKQLLADPVDGGLRRFMGVPVTTSDRMSTVATSPTTYKAALLKKNSLALWVKSAPDIFTGTDILAADQVMAIHFYYVVHRYRRINGLARAGVAVVKTR